MKVLVSIIAPCLLANDVSFKCMVIAWLMSEHKSISALEWSRSRAQMSRCCSNLKLEVFVVTISKAHTKDYVNHL